ncbi:MAG: hypothetical protein CL814_07820 [Confluentimicrobium sp.]|jgi:hypothetical protein|uniref:DUF6478 family protein n=1 Tax=Actibacterium sp. TaxID=1872125 RepID=UPI000C3D40B6|nr:DUF6478 family protein [Actibacterium sp.]MBC56828.1 hypothetical protein [Actibacterium sp.]|tara:strand:+ start:4371 stop:5144 length:774 start_codon:yes stop_codon:yes gene_type:complete
MAAKFDSLFDRLVQRRSLRRWTMAADHAGELDLQSLRALRTRARQLRRQVNRLIHVADGRLALPLIGSNAFQRPMGSDWAYRPELWRGPLDLPGAAAVESKTQIGQEAAIFHDCKVSELTIRQIRNTREEDLAPFGLRMDVFRFDGSFLSLVIELPPEAAQGLKRRHLVRLDTIVEMEKPLEIFARLNIKHGPNVEQIVRELPLTADDVMVEFDLAYTKLNEKRVERMWLDLIFEGPEMNQIILRDVALSRRPRAEL